MSVPISEQSPTAPSPVRRSALEDPGFRRLALLVAAVPLALGYVWNTVVEPLAEGFHPNDFFVYVTAARNLAAGHDLYATHFNSTVPDPSAVPSVSTSSTSVSSRVIR